jgi:hypothetical protein
MLYTFEGPRDDADRVRFFLTAEAALAQADPEHEIHAVAVEFEDQMRRVVPRWTDPELFDPSWTTPAQPHADGSLTARGPIPRALYRI